MLGGNAVLNIGDVSGLQTALDAKAPAGSYAPSVHNHNDLYPTDAEVASAINSAVADKISIDTNTSPLATNYAVGFCFYGVWWYGSTMPTHNGTVNVFIKASDGQIITSMQNPPPIGGGPWTLLPGTWRSRQPHLNEGGGGAMQAVQRVA